MEESVFKIFVKLLCFFIMFDSGYEDTSTDMQLKKENLIGDFFELLTQIVEKMRNFLKDFKNLFLRPKKPDGDDDLQTQNAMLKEALTKPTVKSLDEVAGIQNIKKALYSLVILPRQQPQLFQNRTVNSILLFGPPGTGKTRLVHALAAQSSAQLYSISLGEIMSSYVGQTERNIQSLFQSLCSSKEFSILFIDELDGICRKRTSSDQEYSRRIKTELMCQLTHAAQSKNLIVMAATNIPWELDSAILRRFQKRLYIPLPNKNERLELFKLFTKNIPIVNNAESLENLIELCEGFSGSDISTVVNDALDIPITELEDTKIWVRGSDGFYEPYNFEYISVIDPNAPDDILIQNLSNFAPYSIKARTVSTVDFLRAAKNVQSTVSCAEIRKYDEFVGKLKV